MDPRTDDCQRSAAEGSGFVAREWRERISIPIGKSTVLERDPSARIAEGFLLYRAGAVETIKGALRTSSSCELFQNPQML